MSTIYNLGVRFTMHNGVSPVLRLIAADFLHVGHHLSNATMLTGRFRAGLIGAASALAGIQMFKAFEPLVEHGAKLEHFRVQLKAAGYDAREVAGAMSAAWAEQGRNFNVSVADNLKNLHHIANITGSLEEAKHLLPTFNLAEAALQSLKDEKLRAHFSGGERQTYNFARALEEMGIMSTRPGETTHDAEARGKLYANDLLRGFIAMRGLVDGSNLYSTVQNSGGTALKWSRDFMGHELMTLIQTFGQRAGNMSYMMDSYFSQGRATTAAAQAMAKYGMIEPGSIKYDKIGRVIGVKPGGVIGADMMKENWPKWLREVIAPHLAGRDAVTGRKLSPEDIAAGKGIRSDDQLNAVIDEIARNKTVAQAMRFGLMMGSRTMMLKERQNIDRVSPDAVGILQGEDPSLIWKAYHTALDGLQTALGHPLVTEFKNKLAPLTGGIVSLTMTLKDHPQWVLFGAMALAISAGLAVLIGTFALFAALVGVPAMIAVGLTGIIGAMVLMRDKLADLPGLMWKVMWGFGALAIVLAVIGWPVTAVVAGVAALTAGLIFLWGRLRAIVAWIDSWKPENWSKYFKGGPADPNYKAPEAAPRMGVDGMPQLQLQNFIAPAGRGAPIQVHTAVQLDGYTLANVVATHIAHQSDHVHGSAGFNRRMSITPVDIPV